MNQRRGKMHAAGPRDNNETVSLMSLVMFIKQAKQDLEASGESDAALRFEILETWLRNDYRPSGSQIKYNPRAVGL